jgi:hypothetical protein
MYVQFVNLKKRYSLNFFKTKIQEVFDKRKTYRLTQDQVNNQTRSLGRIPCNKCDGYGRRKYWYWICNSCGNERDNYIGSSSVELEGINYSDIPRYCKHCNSDNEYFRFVTQVSSYVDQCESCKGVGSFSNFS